LDFGPTNRYPDGNMTTKHPASPRITGRRNLIICLLLHLSAIWWAGLCHAVEAEDWSRYENWKISSFQVAGAPKNMEVPLKRGLALTGRWRLLRGQKHPRFTQKLLAEDLSRIRLYLAARGYPGALVVPSVKADASVHQVALVINITPGDPVRIGDVRFTGWPDRMAQPDSTTFRPLAVGGVFDDLTVAESTAVVRAHLLNAGFARVKLRHDVQPLGPSLVTVHFVIEAGDFFVIDEVVVDGCSEDLVPLARRTISIPPGSDFSARRLAEASTDLRLTQLFRQVELTVEPSSPGHMSLKAALENGRMRTLEASVGTWSDNPWMVRTSWTHRNLFKRGRGFNVRGTLATHTLNAGLGVTWLGWLSPRARTRAGVDIIGENEDAYDSREYRAEILQSFRPRNRDILNIGTAVSENQITEFDVGSSDTPEPQGRLWEFWIDRKWDRTNDALFPARGGFVKMSLTFAEPWVISQVPYALGQVDGAKYLDLPLNLVVTGRIRLGIATTLKENVEVLANRRFYAGGYNSHRGYKRRGLGPRDDNGNSRGGEVVGLLSTEVRLPALWKLEAALFLDSGNVWAARDVASVAEFPVAVGVTVGLRSPLGPVRLGYAVNIADLVPDQPRRLWHFGIGYPW
jgi:outer membrane protein assembly factor BamA